MKNLILITLISIASSGARAEFLNVSYEKTDGGVTEHFAGYCFDTEGKKVCNLTLQTVSNAKSVYDKCSIRSSIPVDFVTSTKVNETYIVPISTGDTICDSRIEYRITKDSLTINRIILGPLKSIDDERCSPEVRTERYKAMPRDKVKFSTEGCAELSL